MKKLIIVLLVLVSQITASQEKNEIEKEKKKTSFVIMPIHNSVAGFNNVFLGTIELKKDLNLTFYSVFWNNPNFGNLNSGSDLFLETGVGLGFTKGKWYINPSLGFAHGKFLSGATETRIGEGIIPNVLALYHSGRFELELYTAYYKSIRDEGASRDLLLNWVIPGVKLTDHFSMGAFYEQFSQARTEDGMNEQSIYQFTGGYVKFSLNNGVWFRLAVGPNLSTDLGTSKEFYKVQAFIPIK